VLARGCRRSPWRQQSASGRPMSVKWSVASGGLMCWSFGLGSQRWEFRLRSSQATLISACQVPKSYRGRPRRGDEGLIGKSLSQARASAMTSGCLSIRTVAELSAANRTRGATHRCARRICMRLRAGPYFSICSVQHYASLACLDSHQVACGESEQCGHLERPV
jgi:hypothetical protein